MVGTVIVAYGGDSFTSPNSVFYFRRCRYWKSERPCAAKRNGGSFEVGGSGVFSCVNLNSSPRIQLAKEKCVGTRNGKLRCLVFAACTVLDTLTAETRHAPV
jgi:hypothetical protein